MVGVFDLHRLDRRVGRDVVGERDGQFDDPHPTARFGITAPLQSPKPIDANPSRTQRAVRVTSSPLLRRILIYSIDQGLQATEADTPEALIDQIYTVPEATAGSAQ